MKQELRALENNDTWEVTSLPAGKKAIGSRWVFKLKLNPDGSVDRYKARLAVKGYTQIEGVDYFDSLSPVAKSVTFDVNNAFLHGHLDEEVYLVPTEGYAGTHFGQSANDHCLFLKWDTSTFTTLLVYVDNILLVGDSMFQLEAVKTYLHDLFTIKDLGHGKYFFGLEIVRSSHGLIVTQSKFLHDIILYADMLHARPVATPFPLGIHLTVGSGSLLSFFDRSRWLISRLLYLGFTSPDISFVVHQLSQFIQHPHSSRCCHACAVIFKGFFFPSQCSLHLFAYFDASWASCLDSRHSITDFCIFLGSSLVSWRTKK
ncbi:UNVERIFIED_CONTAM: Retrovirus-related Pol polyprotein from transposon TNT 1-94 [Sesamum indicum]